MNKFSITINGASYPALLTNGAMLRYQRETGKEVSDISSFGDWLALIYCCVVSGCRREGVAFSLTFEDFAEATTPEDVERWVASVTPSSSDATAGAGGEKKS